MNYKDQIKGIAIECNLDGIITSIKVDSLHIKNKIEIGQPFTILVQNELKKALSFIKSLKTEGVAFDWEFNIETEEKIEILHFVGGKINDKLLIVGSTLYSDLLNYFYEIMKINNEHINQFRLHSKISKSVNNNSITNENKIYNDITQLNNELTNMQRQLAKSNIEKELQSQKLKITLKSIGDGVITTDDKGYINFMNPVAIDITEVDYREMDNIHINDIFKIYNENTKESIENIFEKTILKDTYINNTDNSLILNKKYINYSASTIKSSSGILWGMVLVFNDITKIKENENKLKTAMKELQRSNEELEQFAYSVSHDLKSPLTVVISYLRLVNNNYADKLDDNYKSISEQVENRVSRMVDLIDNLLFYSKINSKSDKSFTKIDANLILEDALENLENLIKETNSKIQYDNLTYIYGDKPQLTSLFQNLISNGIKAQKENVDPIIKIKEEDLDDKWMFSISDNGIGIEEKDKDKIFLLFKRLENKIYKGYGIGLAFCKKIVERHNGEIWFDSTPNEGTIFHFTISKNIQTSKSLA